MAGETEIEEEEVVPPPADEDDISATQASVGAALADDVDGNAQGDQHATTSTNEEAENVALDPANSERQLYHDPFTNVQREIWRPGDGDGDRMTEYFNRPGPVLPFEQRWRFYQSPTGTGPIQRDKNEPPKYVFLDDLAAHELLVSEMHRSSLVKYWPHDFGGSGKIRTRRPHRGRGAIGDPDATGSDRYYFVTLGQQEEKYYFTGQADYEPVLYRSPQTAELQASEVSTPPTVNSQPEKKAHNQWTPKDQRTTKRKRHGAVVGKNEDPTASRLFGKAPFPTAGPSQTSRAISNGLTQHKKQKTANEAQSVGHDKANMSVHTEDDSLHQNTAAAEGMLSCQEEPQRQTYLSRSDRQETMRSADEISTKSGMGQTENHGHYVTNLEAELAAAKETIEEQAAQIALLQRSKEEAQANVEELKAVILVLEGKTGIGEAA